MASNPGGGRRARFAWLKNGWVRFRRLPGYRGRCLCWADAAELKRLRKLRDTPHGWWDPPLPAALTTPKPRAVSNHAGRVRGRTTSGRQARERVESQSPSFPGLPRVSLVLKTGVGRLPPPSRKT
jgi:hypothetical protein